MSVRAMTWAWEVQGITATQKLVLLKLADRANDDFECWPGKASIAKACSIKSVRTVTGIIKSLEEARLVTIERRRNPDNPKRHETNFYRLNVDQQELLPRADIALGQKLPYGKSQQDLGQSEHQGRANFAHESLTESKNQPLNAVARAREAPAAFDYENWHPDEPVLNRIRMDNPGITAAFLESERLEFITLAEDQKLRPNLMRARFTSQVRRHWRETRKREGNRGPLRTVARDLRDVPDAQLVEWSRARDGPEPQTGETFPDYRQRITEHLTKRERSEQHNPAIEQLAGSIRVN